MSASRQRLFGVGFGWWLLTCVCGFLGADDGTDRSRFERLQAEIARHDELYFKQALPEITDAEYDALKRELAMLERAHPDWGSRHGPPDERSGLLPTRVHGRRMLSLEKAYTEAEWREFYMGMMRRLRGRDAAFVVEPKYDGVAISLVYERGHLVRALTRGNGREGDDVTASVRRIPGVRLDLNANQNSGSSTSFPDLVELRGEVYVDFAEFARLNALRASAGEEPYAHPRNLAAGTLMSVNEEEVASRRLSVVIHGWGDWRGAGEPGSQQAFHALVWAWGLPGVHRFRAVRSADEGWEAIEEFRLDRPRLAFPIDGVVVKLDDVPARALLGESERAPRWAIACKYEPERVVAQIRGITIQVGRTGVLTPVAELEPVELGGARVTRATLHNRGVIARRDIRIRDFVEVERAGDVIPAVTSVRLAQRPPDAQPYVFPSHCPSCDEPVSSPPGEVTVRCVNGECPEQRQRRLEHFASSEAVDIPGLGPATIAALVEAGRVRRPADFYRLRLEDIEEVKGIGMGSAERLLAAIERSRQVELWRIIYGLGIPQVGTVNSRKLADACGSLAAFETWTEEQLAAVVGPAAGRSAIRYLEQAANRENLRALSEQVVSSASPRLPAETLDLNGKVVVFTGVLPGLTRERAAERVRSAGGTVRDEVTAEASFVVAGDRAGKKLEDARRLGVNILSPEDFARLFGR